MPMLSVRGRPPIKVRTLLLATLVLVTTRSDPAVADSPYAGICQRNAFHLRPRAAMTVEMPHPIMPKIHLTGITTILRGKRALLKVEVPGKPSNQAQSYILKEGERAGPLAVLQINEKAELVKVDYSGTVTNLTFEKLPPTVAPTAPVAPKPPVRWGGMKPRTTFH